MDIKKLIKKAGIPLVCCTLFASCVNDVDLSNVSTDISLMDHLLIPLGKTSIKTNDFLKDLESEHLKENSTENYYFLQFSNSGSFDFRDVDLFSGIPQQIATSHRIVDNAIQSISEAMGIDSEVLEVMFEMINEVSIPNDMAVKDIVFNDTLKLGLNTDTDDMRLDSLLLSVLQYELTLGVTGVTGVNFVDITFAFDPKYIQYETSFSLPLNDSHKIDLSNVMLVLPDSENDGGIPFSFTITLNTKDSLTIHKDAKIILNHHVLDFDFEALYGAINSAADYSYEGEVDVDIPADFAKNASLKLYNPQLSLTLYNGIGMEIDFMANLKTSAQGIESEAVSADFSLNARPERYGDEPQKSVFVLDRDNGGTHKLFNGPVPDKLKYAFSVARSTNSEHPEWADFLGKNSEITYDMDIVVPLQLDKESSFSHTDTIYDIGLNEAETELTADSVSLYLEVESGLPITAYLSLTLLDENGQEITSQLNREDLIAPIYAGKVDETGRVTESTISQLRIPIKKKEFEDLKATKDLVLNFKVDGKDKNGDFQRIYFSPEDSLKVQLSVAISGGKIAEK